MYPFLSVVDQVTIIKQGVEQLQPVIICLLKGKELKHWLPLGWRHWLLGGRSRKKTFPCVLFFITLEFVRVIVHIKIKHLKTLNQNLKDSNLRLRDRFHIFLYKNYFSYITENGKLQRMLATYVTDKK